MPIIRSPEQPSMSLEEFYTDMSETSTNAYALISKNMLTIVGLINETFRETTIYGLISHARLVLQTAGDWKAPWYVIISNGGLTDFHFEYLMPADKRPWENAYVHGKADSLEEGRRYLLIAMHESGGWSGNKELAALLAAED